MSKEPLEFTLLSVRRMPGLPRGLPIYRDFVPHLNIIIGPNASGKSSTARALRDLIWRHADGQITAHGVAALAGREWELTVDGRKATSRLNGEEAPLRGIPAWEGRDRYTLAMHELLSAEDGDLARQVVNASTGYDLAAADKALGYHLGGIKTNTTLYQNYAKAKADYDTYLRGQEDLLRQQQKLSQLVKQKFAAEQAEELLGWSHLLLEYMRCKSRFSQAEAILKGMPHVLAEMSGREYDELIELKRQLNVLFTNIGVEEETITKAKGQQVKLGFPEGSLEEGLTTQLEQKINGWIELDRQIAESEQDLAAAIAREQEALKRLGADRTAVDWNGVSSIEIDVIEEHLQQLHQWLSRRAAMEEVVVELRKSRSAEELPSPEKLTTGIQSLLKWLQVTHVEERPHILLWSIWVLAVMGVASTFATLLYGQPGLIGLLLFIVVVIFVLYFRKKTSDSVPALRRADYESLGLSAPSNWNDAGVTERLNELADLLGKSKWDQEAARRIHIQQDELLSIETEGVALRKQYEELSEKVRLLPKLPSGNLRTYDGMFWFIRYATDWSGCRAERKAWEEKIQAMQGQRNVLIHDINELFKRAVVGPVSDSIAAKTLRQQLADGEIRWREAEILIDGAEKNISRFRANGAEAQGKVSSLYARLGVEVGEEEMLRDLVRQVSTHRQGRQQVDEAFTLLSAARRSLQNHLLFNTYKEDVETADVLRIERQIMELTSRGDSVGEIRDEISQINANISLAEGGNSLEDSLKKMEDSVAALEMEYDRRLASTAGRLLTDALKKEADERDRPAVFKAADSLFSWITHGQYRLRLKGGESPAFSAYETTEGEGRELDHLSTGTRIQLLLAVRLAFIDSLEETVSIPIIADELLANSDSRRSAAIMEALVEFSRQGRQIFYFSSQEEEVSRWESFLADKTDISKKTFRIGKGDNENYLSGIAVSGRQFGGAHLLEVIPDPSGLDHAQYGKALGNRYFNPMVDGSDRLHVWYLFEDPLAVYRLLKSGLVHWGQVQVYLQAGGDMSEIDQSLLPTAAQKIKILSRYLELYRHGRSLAIDRSVLERSGAVSAIFIDTVNEKLEEVGYDPEQLLTALGRAEVPRFSGRKIDQLREFLVDDGFISEDKILSPEEIWVLLAAFVSQTGINLEEAQRFVDRVLVQ
jgi:hypothetical protein